MMLCLVFNSRYFALIELIMAMMSFFSRGNRGGDNRGNRGGRCKRPNMFRQQERHKCLMTLEYILMNVVINLFFCYIFAFTNYYKSYKRKF
jgi:hypothetical protein